MSYSQRISAVASVAAFALLAVPVALAQSGSANVNAGVRAGVGVSVGAGNALNASATGTANMNSTSTVRGKGATSTNSATGTAMRAENRSGVSVRVQALLQVADRDGGIGSEVRVIAQEYASTSKNIDEAQDAVESRPGWLTFLFGSDYGNLGKLRSELVTTENQIQRLTNAMNRSVDATVKADLQVQISALEAEASTTAAFIEENEGSFSLFGWLVRVFQ